MIEIYTDGSSLDQTKRDGDHRGGAAYIVVDKGDIIHEYSERFVGPGVTNNTMEMTAMLNAIECVSKNNYKATIYSDSKYVVDGINSWMPSWKKDGWTKKRGEIANLQLWKDIDTEIESLVFDVKFEWVKAHNGNKYNEIVDDMAREAAYEKGL